MPALKKGRKGLPFILAGLLLFSACAADEGGSVGTDSSQYPNPPEGEWMYTLTIYWTFNGAGGEFAQYALAPEGIIEEGIREDPAAAGAGEELLPDTPPGGREFNFRGVSPGDVVLTISTTDSADKTVRAETYVLRVYDDLRLAVLDTTELD